MKSNLLPIYLREVRSLFYSPVAWLVLFAFYLLAGFFWASPLSQYAAYSLMAASRGGGSEMKLVDWLIAPYFGNVAVTFIFLLPLVSMRQFSEEKKSGTIEILFTWPFSDLDIVLGKWFASLTLLAAMLAPTLLNFVMIADKTALPWPVLASGFAGIFMVGACFLAVGLFTSALTENQVVAAALSFGTLLLLFILSWVEAQTSGLTKDLVGQLSIISHLQALTKGLVDLKDITYFVLFTVLMLFGTLRVLESKKWR
ncbi:MAG TPA: ABC transporter permease [bacterium]|jgi:ABC-2 type transport system permease protein|nr:ABC transporter permease [bacterium]